MKERRRHARKPMTGRTEIRSEENGGTIDAYIGNISTSGMAVYSKELLSPGTSVTLSLHFFGRERMESSKGLRAKVISTVKLDKGFQIGLCFYQSIIEENEPALFAFLTHSG